MLPESGHTAGHPTGHRAGQPRPDRASSPRPDLLASDAPDLPLSRTREVSLLWTTCPDLTGRPASEDGQGYGCFGECSLIAESLVDKMKPANRAPETVGGGR